MEFSKLPLIGRSDQGPIAQLCVGLLGPTTSSQNLWVLLFSVSASQSVQLLSKPPDR